MQQTCTNDFINFFEMLFFCGAINKTLLVLQHGVQNNSILCCSVKLQKIFPLSTARCAELKQLFGFAQCKRMHLKYKFQ
jgi:hypothetical protein